MAPDEPAEQPPRRVRRRFWLALALSALFHAVMLLSSDRWRSVDLPDVATQLPPPLEAVIVPGPPAPAPSPPPVTARRAAPPASAPGAPPPVHVAEPSLASAIEPDPLPAAPEPPPEVAQPEAVAPAPAQRPMPRRIEMRYALTTGEESVEVGVVYGEWTLEGDRYVARAVAEAKGLLALFFSGQVVAESRGTLTPQGLRPDAFMLQRGVLERTDAVQFDWNALTATMTSRGGTQRVPLRRDSQDQLSFIFQFAFAYPGEGEYVFDVLTGRKAVVYTYRVQGEERIETFLGPFLTRRVDRLRDPGDRSVDAWLAVEFYYLPVRLRLTDKSGQSADLMVTALRIEP